jgi:hypothetical protein
MNKKPLLTFIMLFAAYLAVGLGQSYAQEPDYDPEARLVELGIELPTPPSPVANYVNGGAHREPDFFGWQGSKVS